MAEALSFTAKVTGLEESVATAWNKISSSPRTLKFKLDDQVSQPLGRISAGVNSFDRSLDAATKRVVAFGITAGIFQKVKQSVEEFVRSTVEVQSSLTKINANLNLSQKGIQDFGNQIFNSARQAGKGFKEAAEAAELLSRQNLGATETTKRLNDSLTLSRIAGISVGDAVKDLTLTFNTYQREGITTTNIIDRLQTVHQKFGISAAEVADAIERSGETAQEAGVHFNQLLGLITAIESVTRRGGAAGGSFLNNALNKLQQPALQNKLPGFGIATTDSKNNPLSSLQILQNTANRYAGTTPNPEVAELISGQRQSNLLNALLQELAKNGGIVAQTIDAVGKAEGAAAGQTDKLNKSLDAQINSLKVTGTQLLNSVGKGTVSPVISDLTSTIEAWRKSLSGEKGGALGDNTKLGETIGSGIIKGISNVLIGPGAALISLTLGRAFGKAFSYAKRDLASITGIRAEAELRERVEAKIVEIINQGTEAEKRQYAAAATVGERQEILLGVLQKITLELEKQAAFKYGLTESFLEPGFFGKKPIKALGLAGGYIPAISREMSDIAAGVGGASSSAKPVVIPNFNFGNGRIGPAVANTDEYIVNHAGGSSIFNKNMVNQYGLPDGAKHLSKGHIPNFATSYKYGELTQKGNENIPITFAKTGALNQLFESISKANTLEETHQFGPKIIDLAKGLAQEKQVLKDLFSEQRAAQQRGFVGSRTFSGGQTNEFGNKINSFTPLIGEPSYNPNALQYSKNEQEYINELRQRAAQSAAGGKSLPGPNNEELILQRQFEKSKGGFANKALGLSFLLPFLAGFIPEGKSGEASGRISGGVSQGVNFGGTALGITSLLGVSGPIGITIAAIAAAGGGLIGALNKWNKSISEEVEGEKETGLHKKLKELADAAAQAAQTVKGGGGTLGLAPNALLSVSDSERGAFRQAALIGRQGGGGVPLLNNFQRAQTSLGFYQALNKTVYPNLNEEEFEKEFKEVGGLRAQVQSGNLQDLVISYLQQRNPAGRYRDIRGNPSQNNIDQGLQFAAQAGGPTAAFAKAAQEAEKRDQEELVKQGVINNGLGAPAGSVGPGGIIVGNFEAGKSGYSVYSGRGSLRGNDGYNSSLESNLDKFRYMDAENYGGLRNLDSSLRSQVNHFSLTQEPAFQFNKNKPLKTEEGVNITDLRKKATEELKKVKEDAINAAFRVTTDDAAEAIGSAIEDLAGKLLEKYKIGFGVIFQKVLDVESKVNKLNLQPSPPTAIFKF